MEKQINIIGKTAIIDGKKTKVIGESGNEITAVFQEDGKYKKGNQTITIPRSGISLLDQRKHPEKYLFSEEQKKIVSWCEMMVKNIEDNNQSTGLSYIDLLRKRLQEAKKLNIDVSDVENRIDELTELAVKSWIDMMVKNIEDNNQSTGLFYIELLRKRLQEAKKLNIDVSDVENRIDELTELAMKKTT